MLEFLGTLPAQVVISGAVLSILAATGYYLVRRFRDRTDGNRLTAGNMLSNFREMHDEGDISQLEFRTIKTVLGEKVQAELKDNGDVG